MSGDFADLFVAPPFPGARRRALWTPGTPAARDDPAAIVEAIRAHRIGGCSWGRQPESDHLPATDADGVDPWHLFARGTPLMLSGDDPLALLATIAGAPVTVTQEGRFAGCRCRPGRAKVAALVETHLLSGRQWLDPFTGAPTTCRAVIEQLGAWRALVDTNRVIDVALGFGFWKQETVAPLLWGGRPVPFRARADALGPGDTVAIWKARVPSTLLAQVEASGCAMIEVEDGFIRSIGLGADCVPPLSIVADGLGAHYDPRQPSTLERMLADETPSPALLDRARNLRAQISRGGISKYGVGQGALPRPAGERRHVLVTGQVEDDRSMRLGAGGLTNLDLLRRARAEEPDAYLIYRPHPDVMAGHRKGHVPAEEVARLADAVDAQSPISDLIAMVDAIHVLTSLAGFEALVQGKSVTVHGCPFYAGWGLTRDRGEVPARRTRRLSVDALIAAVLIGYPRYLDPVTGLPCPPELLIERMTTGARQADSAVVRVRRAQGMIKRAVHRAMGRA
jgi:capsular polysaccharide export protein